MFKIKTIVNLSKGTENSIESIGQNAIFDGGTFESHFDVKQRMRTGRSITKIARRFHVWRWMGLNTPVFLSLSFVTPSSCGFAATTNNNTDDYQY